MRTWPYLTSVLAVSLLAACASEAYDTTQSSSGEKTVVVSARVKPVPDSVIQRSNGPNIFIVLMDDTGFSLSSTFGGPVPTPNLDALAAEGLRYNRFHTAAMCSPTRAALLTGRNHHRVEMGGIVNLAVGVDGYTSVIPEEAATIGDVLGEAGYSTAWFGKNHVTPVWEFSEIGPFDRWPTGLGFDYFYGFMQGASDQISPILVENTTVFEPPNSGPDDGYFFDRDMADQTIAWMNRQNTAAPDKPFLIYMAPGTGHEPHQAPKDWLKKFEGRFDQGWDVLREEIFARQTAEGIIPENTVISPRPDIMPAWESLSADEKKVSARQMEAHAAQRAYFDHQFGRVIDAIKASGEWDNTLVLFVDGDNGASGTGGLHGSLLGLLNFPQETTDYMIDNIDLIGGAKYQGNHSAMWAWATATPFQWYKQKASRLGGTRNGLVVSWPEKIKDGGIVRSHYGHVNDIAATLYEAAGVTLPDYVDGAKQMPLDGKSLVPSFTDGHAPEMHTSQYYEMLGNKGMYKDGWLAAIDPPNIMWKPGAYKGEREWRLYNLKEDYAQSVDVSTDHPEILTALKAEFDRRMTENGSTVIPGGAKVRTNPKLRPSIFRGRNEFIIHPTQRPILDKAFPAINNRNWTMSVPIRISDDQNSGTIISQGGYPFGWGVYLFDGEPHFAYINQPDVNARLKHGEKLEAGDHVLEFGMVPLSPKPGGSARMWMSVDDGPRITQDISGTVLTYWGANGVGIGREVGMLTLEETGKPFAFEGEMGALKLTFSE